MRTAKAIGIRSCLAARRKKTVPSTARIQRAVAFADETGIWAVTIPATLSRNGAAHAARLLWPRQPLRSVAGSRCVDVLALGCGYAQSAVGACRVVPRGGRRSSSDSTGRVDGGVAASCTCSPWSSRRREHFFSAPRDHLGPLVTLLNRIITSLLPRMIDPQARRSPAPPAGSLA